MNVALAIKFRKMIGIQSVLIINCSDLTWSTGATIGAVEGVDLLGSRLASEFLSRKKKF